MRILEDMDDPACIVCGCSSDRPCPGGCIWIDPAAAGMEDICSRCWADPDVRAIHDVSEEDGTVRGLQDLDEEFFEEAFL